MAAAVLHNKVVELVAPKVIVTSSGTSNYHVGEGPNKSSLRTWEAAGYNYKHIAKQFNPESFVKQDLILCMDLSNRAMVLTAAKSDADRSKVFMLPSHSTRNYNRLHLRCTRIPGMTIAIQFTQTRLST